MTDSTSGNGDKVRLLFVDDQPELLAALRSSLRRQRKVWEMHFASSGEEAAEIARQSPPDVVVSDMRMPVMNGVQVLTKIRELAPQALRFVLSGQAEEELTIQAIPLVHQWLAKPCERDELVRTIDRALMTRDLLALPETRAIVGAVSSLPTVPRTYHALMGMLGSADASMDDVATLISQDSALCARVLQMANSAFFGLPRQLADARDAVTMLGLDTLSRLVLTAEIVGVLRPSRSVQGFTMDRFLARSHFVSRLAGSLVADEAQSVTASTAGLLHDLGQLVLVQHDHARFERCLLTARQEDRSLQEVEQEVWGTTHAEVGAALLGQWGLPNALVQAVAHHHAPARLALDAMDEVSAVHVAQALCEEFLPVDVARESEVVELDPQVLGLLGSSEEFASLRRRASEEASLVTGGTDRE